MLASEFAKMIQERIADFGDGEIYFEAAGDRCIPVFGLHSTFVNHKPDGVFLSTSYFISEDRDIHALCIQGAVDE